MEVINNNKTVLVIAKVKNKKKTFSGDFAIVTPTAKAVSLMTFEPPLPYMKKYAIDSLNFFGSVKIFLKFTKPFWAYKNKLPIIKYGNMSTVNGGSGISDDILRMVCNNMDCVVT